VTIAGQGIKSIANKIVIDGSDLLAHVLSESGLTGLSELNPHIKKILRFLILKILSSCES
jgi:PIN domain nuclease of toxin-antitoxin system